MGEGVLVPEPVSGGPPVGGIGVLGLGGEDAGEALAAVGGGRVVELQLVHPLEVEGERAGGAVDLHAHRVLAPLRHAGGLERAEDTGGEAGGEQGDVVDRHLLALAVGVALAAQALRGPVRGAGGDDGLQRAGDGGDVLAGEPLGEVDDVGADVAQRSGAGELLVQPPGHRRIRVGEPVLEVVGADLADLAHRTLGDQLPGVGQRRGAAVAEAAQGEGPARARLLRRGGRGRHLRGVLDRVRQRLLAQHVLAGRERRERDLVVRVPGGADVDHVDLRVLDHVLPAGGPGGEAEALGGLGHRALGAPREGAQLGRERKIEEAVGGAPGMGMGRAHEPVPDHADPQGAGASLRRGHRGSTAPGESFEWDRGGGRREVRGPCGGVDACTGRPLPAGGQVIERFPAPARPEPRPSHPSVADMAC